MRIDLRTIMYSLIAIRLDRWRSGKTALRTWVGPGGMGQTGQIIKQNQYNLVDGGSAASPCGSVSTALGPRPPPLPFLDFDGSLAVSETSSRVAPRCGGAPRPANISRCSRA